MGGDLLYKNKYQVNSIRWRGWNYGWAGYYFVTICVAHRQCVFGKIKNGKMVVNEAGKIVSDEWLKTGVIRPNVYLHEHVVMPNHFHAVIEIVNINNNVETHCMRLPNTGNAATGDACNASLRPDGVPNKFGPQKNNLASIIRGFKSATTALIRKTGFDSFSWQPLYHDHIIRDEFELARIQKYIQDNPANWENDELF